MEGENYVFYGDVNIKDFATEVDARVLDIRNAHAELVTAMLKVERKQEELHKFIVSSMVEAKKNCLANPAG